MDETKKGPTNPIDLRSSELKKLFRGVWCDRLNSGQELPVGGLLFNPELMTTKLVLDFEALELNLQNFNPETIDKFFEQNQSSMAEWLKQAGSDIDPRLFHACYQVQMQMQQSLDVDPAQTESSERKTTYRSHDQALLSSLKGKSACAERAALGQYLFQKIGLESSYVSGVTIHNPDDLDEYSNDHSFIVIPHKSKTYIFDIARPHSQNNLPRILETAVPFNHELLLGKKELLVETKDVLDGGSIWYGVGEPVSGAHKTIGFEK